MFRIEIFFFQVIKVSKRYFLNRMEGVDFEDEFD